MDEFECPLPLPPTEGSFVVGSVVVEEIGGLALPQYNGPGPPSARDRGVGLAQ